jgi:hypothetical protein
MAKFTSLPIKDIDEKLELCPLSPSGLRWKSRACRNVRAGDPAGSVNSRGYWRVQLNQKTYFAHRIIFYLQTGEDPGPLFIDHVNGVQDNFSLRLATPQQNQYNKQKAAGKTSRYKGVVFTTQNKKNNWKATIALNGKNKLIGYYSNEVDAAVAYDEAAKRVFKEYALTNF